MESNHEPQAQRESRTGEPGVVELGHPQGVPLPEEYVAPGIPIVRSNTSRPLNFGASSSDFPMEAPSAPPVPEESEAPVSVVEFTPLPVPGKPETTDALANEFVWLFEYGLEMDISILNSPERLDGFALFYGIAVLKGYQIAFEAIGSPAGHFVATLVPSREHDAEVWGVLYRVPRRMVERVDAEPSLLDKAHTCFEPVQVTVHEAYRGRDIACITYIAKAAARQEFRKLPFERQIVAAASVQHLLEVARKQNLPGEYLQRLSSRFAAQLQVKSPASSGVAEQNTEPLPILLEKKRGPSATNAGPQLARTASSNRWMMGFALYLVVLFLTVCMLAVIQGLGFGRALFTATFTVLGIPWFILVYGLLGGCISSIVTLGRYQTIPLPSFVLMTWFTRPYIGAVLAGLTYLLLTSGIFALHGNAQQHEALFSLAGVVAGFCEGWIFSRQAR